MENFEKNSRRQNHRRVEEITAYGKLHLYAPVSYDSITALIGASSIDVAVRYAHAEEYREAVAEYTKLTQDTVLYIPSDIPRTKSLGSKDNSRNRQRISRSFLSDCIYLIEDDKGKHPRVLLGQHGDYSILKAAAKHRLASELYTWLIRNPSVTKVMVADSAIMLDMMANVDKPYGSTTKALMLRPFTAEISGIKRTLMVVPTPAQLDKNQEKGFHLASEIFDIIQDVQEAVSVKGEILKSEEDLESAILRIDSYFSINNKKEGGDDTTNSPVAIDLETSGLNPHFKGQRILSCQFSAGTDDLTFAFIVDHPYRKGNNPELGYRMLKKIISKVDWTYVFQNGKYDMKWMKHFVGRTPAGKLADTMLLDHYLNETYGSLGNALKIGLMAMDSQIPRYLHYPSHKSRLTYALAEAPYLNDISIPKAKDITTIEEVDAEIKRVSDGFVEIRSGQYMHIPTSLLLSYGMDDAYATARIYHKMIARILADTGGTIPKVITHLHERQMRVAAEMEYNGFPIDYARTRREIARCDILIEDESDILEGMVTFNYKSDKEVLDYLKRVKGYDLTLLIDERSGKYSLDSEHIMMFAQTEPWIPHMLNYKKALKARNTYLIPFIQHSYKGIVYFSLNLHGTATGRLSAMDPNFQNIPKKIRVGDTVINVKPVLHAGSKEHALFDADLKNAEVKVLTVYVPDKQLMKAIREGTDLHCYASSIVHGVTYEESFAAKQADDADSGPPLTDRQVQLLNLRSNAKRATFGKIYGVGYAGFVKQMRFEPGTSKEEMLSQSKETLDKLETDAYPALRAFSDTVVSRIEQTGYAQTVFGRRRRFTKSAIYTIHKFLKAYQESVRTDAADAVYAERANFYRDRRPVRQFLNMLVQSTTSDYFQDMLYELLIHGQRYGIKMFVTVHDSVVGSIPIEKGRGESVKKLLTNIVDKMPKKRYKELPVSIGIDCKFMTNYGEADVAVIEAIS